MSITDTVTLKDDFTLLLSGADGDLTGGLEGHGMYLHDTRYLSLFELTVNGAKPDVLSHTLDYNIAATFRAGVPFIEQVGDGEHEAFKLTHAPNAIGVARQRYIKRGLIESLEFMNYHPEPLKVAVALRVSADFADIFEVRGMRREAQGHSVHLDEPGKDGSVVFRSHAIATQQRQSRQDGRGSSLRTVERIVRFECDRAPDGWEPGEMRSVDTGLDVPLVTLRYNLDLQPHEPVTLHIGIMPEPQATAEGSGIEIDGKRVGEGFRAQVVKAKKVFTRWQEVCAQVQTGNYELDRTFETGTLDLRSLMQQWPQGLVVTAGIPWYFTLFGRDSLITGLETLALNPQISVDTLRALAAYQATEFDDWRDSEPGKILHELRVGDITLNNETPHSPYYGSVDSTLLFILLYAETLKWTGDQAFFRELWPNVQRALNWAWRYGDIDGDGFIEYTRRSSRGIRHQGWKDSDESMGGTLGPRPSMPLALVEVQGYYYAALVELAWALRSYGDTEQKALAARLEKQGAGLKEKFNREFWYDEIGFYAQALDADKKPILSVTSNLGHCLWNGIVDEEKARMVVDRLMSPDMLSGWGVRTLSAREPTYNPMSYHNGSVWPHDNALLVAGLRRYSFHDEMLEVAKQIFSAAATFPQYRLPELYCGFPRGVGAEREGAPAAYPVSCSPQAWAAGTPMLLLQALLGLQVDAREGDLTLSPVLPAGVDSVALKGLAVGGRRIDLSVARDASGQFGLGIADPAQEAAGDIQVRLRPATGGTQPSREIGKS